MPLYLYVLIALFIAVLAVLLTVLILRLRMVPRKLLEETSQRLGDQQAALGREVASLQARLDTAIQALGDKEKEIDGLKRDHHELTGELNQTHRQLAEARAVNRSMQEKLDTQKEEIAVLGKKINQEFELIASRILDEKTEKFTRQNKDHLEIILKPLGENIDKFRVKVEEVYEKEARERFSLGKEVQRLMELNQQVSQDAINLTNALKGQSKIQGDWGQMILENILEQSGLEHGREYLVQEYLKDADGQYLKNEAGQRMQPDVIVRYPDNRQVIIDAKVSLTAYSRYAEATDSQVQEKALKEHLLSLRRHVDELSAKNYQDFAPSVDFVMMFVPVEPAYLLALKHEQKLWEYAYGKRILLISPTHLIAALKLIEDLWKREHQNQNAMAIAEQGAKLYEKFVGFVDSLSNVGGHLDKAHKSYEKAFGQLSAGRGNLIGQAEKLRDLGVKAKKTLPPSLLEESEHKGPEDA